MFLPAHGLSRASAIAKDVNERRPIDGAALTAWLIARAGGDGAVRVGGPVRPGADVERRGPPRQRQRQHLVGGGDAGSAVGADLALRRHTERAEPGRELRGGPEGARGGEVLARGAGGRRGDV